MLGQNEKVAEKAQLYILVYLLGLYFQSIKDLEIKLMVNLGKNS